MADDVSYAVFDVAAEKSVSPSFVLSQKVATLLTQIDRGNERSALPTIEFLNETLEQYSHFQKLRRYLDLKGKKDPTDEETTLMEEIRKREDLKPFLPK